MLPSSAMVKTFWLPLIFATAVLAQNPADRTQESQNRTTQDGRHIYREQIPTGQSHAEFDMSRMRINELGYFELDLGEVTIQPTVSCSVPLSKIEGDKNAKVQLSTPRNVDPRIVIPPKQPACPERKSELVEEKRVILLPEKK